MSSPTDWRPIETAPKDDSVVLLYGNGWTTMGWWDADCEAWEDDRVPEYSAACVWTPTHWMPLPPSPTILQTGGK